MPPTPYQVYAVKYGENSAPRARLFIDGGGDDHESIMDMDFFVWAIIGDERTWVVDTGFSGTDAAQRNRRLVRPVAEALATVGVDAATATDVIITHLHYDHVGGAEQFPMARFHLQDAEMAYATGRHMTKSAFGHAYTGEHIAGMVRNVFDQRVVFHDGDEDLAPGLSVHLIGGHTLGLQVVRVWTEVGWLVLASDSTHYYENMNDARPFSIVHDVGAMIAGYDRLRELADDHANIVPGHDPLVFQYYPPAATGLDGIAVRLDGGRA
jgi:glyoxylase-like metal-dependent hydrolase (beta-lactamase superfamily II)